MSTLAAGLARRWLVPEVVQTSAMDCGPASLKSLLEGFRVPVSYGRLREACQTDVDGTSIDSVEMLANQLGVAAEQVLIPIDHLFVDSASALPAVVVVRHSDGATHFVVVWRRVGGWVQVMDPAIGRRWLRSGRFLEEVFRHETTVPASEWREWAVSPDFLRPLAERMARLGATPADTQALVDEALADETWFGLAALDAAVRFIASVMDADGLRKGPEALRVTHSVFRDTHRSTDDIFHIVPPRYWSAWADRLDDQGELQLTMSGAVLVRLSGRTATAPAAGPDAVRAPEMKAALLERPQHPLALIRQLLQGESRLSLAALAGAMAVGAGAVLIEALMFRGLFDLAGSLTVATQRLLAFLAVLGFCAVLLVIELAIASEVMRLGRQLEARLRIALLEKLPQLTDRYFHSRPVSDMAERSHSLQTMRLLPGLTLHLLQALCDIAFTLAGIALIDRASVGPALLIVLAAIVIPLALQPLLNESDLRVRNHSSALHVFYLDALLGLVPIRSHAAEPAVRRRHEGLLVEWARSARGQLMLSVGTTAVQALACVAMGAWLIAQHFAHSATVSGADLLLVYWTLKLPALGHSLASLAQQYPAQRNVLARLMEPLSAPAEAALAHAAPETGQGPHGGVEVQVEQGRVVVAGHTILEDLDVIIRPGEHVAVVGSSGAGKSTLLGLLLGWNRLADGTLRLDGARAAAADVERLRRHTAWVDPAIQLWNKPLLDNLLYATSDTRGLEQIGPVLDAARLRGILQKLPEGLQTYLGEGGAVLSGGEGQRVRLARAFLQEDVRLALLDEPFRGLDRGQRHELLAGARKWWSDATLLCVTHDVGETLSFPRVLVVEGGRIVEDGRPADLAATSSRYSEMLAAESDVQARLWRDPQWRRVHVDGGTVRAAAGAGT
ncbi:ATP-binding cassette domain-containing protein [Ramlibacter sp.]|uniref:ATP-binding cassette domain-containing protein n=1 Tax=Ramlibacter sp. TaxID=1917967 RepID=UPI002637BACB|nr:ATP-binding cassette domain-containing protein [Ramlibacter sp.]MDB5955426.1 Lipid export ATP-binding/permease protein MsbA [Ramlibacter sp.]